ncbi:cystatin domain-containing protein [Vibrio atypicus]|uniref:cystatin domain-containing protein n=1 Tax=Vibrio atypicus TaxID=558271 RepID=UPI00135ACB75|nr:cystatin domain-containing protein [Vibrio atypicus]
MKTILAASVLSVMVLTGCAKQTEPQKQISPSNPMCSTKTMPGGWSVSDVTPGVEKALDNVLAQMNTASKLKQINEVRTQIVNGTNYAIEFTLENGEVWHTVVYRNLRDDYMIEQVAQQGPLCP